METVLYIISAVVTVIVIAVAAFFFGIPGWVPPDRKPDKETMTIIAVILGLMMLVIIGAAIWETIIK